MSGLRVVLVAPQPAAGDRALAATLAAIVEYGWDLVGLVTPENHLEALRLVVSGEADAVLAARPEYVRAVMFTGDLPSPMGDAGPRNERTRMVPRHGEGQVYTKLVRRPGAVA